MADSKNSKSTNGKDEEEQVDERKYFEKVLEDVLSLNSLLTVAVFVGLSLDQPGPVQSLQGETSCIPDEKISKRLVSYEIASFSCFICSACLAKSIMVFLYIHKNQEGYIHKNQEGDAKNLHRKLRYLVGFYLSIYVSMAGCLLLLLAMVDVIQIKLGRLSCHSKFTVGTVSFMVVAIGLGLVSYFLSVTHGVLVTSKEKKRKGDTVP